MEEKIILTEILEDESGNKIELKRRTGVESTLELAIAESFSEINQSLNNKLKDDEERRIAEKFRLCLNLNNFKKELEI